MYKLLLKHEEKCDSFMGKFVKTDAANRNKKETRKQHQIIFMVESQHLKLLKSVDVNERKTYKLITVHLYGKLSLMSA